MAASGGKTVVSSVHPLRGQAPLSKDKFVECAFHKAYSQLLQGDTSIYVNCILPNSAAAQDGRLRSMDKILSINGADVSNCAHELAVQALSGPTVKLVVQHNDGKTLKTPSPLQQGAVSKQPPVSSELTPLAVVSDDDTKHVCIEDTGSGFGLVIIGPSSLQTKEAYGVFVSKVVPNSPAAEAAVIAEGISHGIPKPHTAHERKRRGCLSTALGGLNVADVGLLNVTRMWGCSM
eukprot:m.333843 g.333843  ORF g.333843 m.333843 type:complete len:234 (+) comp19781_c0_seq22:486-1187(+)